MHIEDWEDMLDELLADESDTMSAWEVDFIESLDRQRSAPEFVMSDKQWSVLQKVWSTVFRD